MGPSLGLQAPVSTGVGSHGSESSGQHLRAPMQLAQRGLGTSCGAQGRAPGLHLHPHVGRSPPSVGPCRGLNVKNALTFELRMCRVKTRSSSSHEGLEAAPPGTTHHPHRGAGRLGSWGPGAKAAAPPPPAGLPAPASSSAFLSGFPPGGRVCGRSHLRMVRASHLGAGQLPLSGSFCGEQPVWGPQGGHREQVHLGEWLPRSP